MNHYIQDECDDNEEYEIGFPNIGEIRVIDGKEYEFTEEDVWVEV